MGPRKRLRLFLKKRPFLERILFKNAKTFTYKKVTFKPRASSIMVFIHSCCHQHRNLTNFQLTGTKASLKNANKDMHIKQYAFFMS